LGDLPNPERRGYQEAIGTERAHRSPVKSRSAAHGLVSARRCRRFGGPSSHLGIGYRNQEPSSVVDRGILEGLCDVRVELL